MKTLPILFTLCTLILVTAAGKVAADTSWTLEPVVVTATRSEQQLFDLPTAISLIDQERLRETSPGSPAEAIDRIAGVSLEKAGSWEASPIIRGLGSNRVLVLYDGDRESNLWAGRMPLTPFVEMVNVERIEVVKGPASALYGSDALGGVINIISKDVLFSLQDELQQQGTFTSRFATVDRSWLTGYQLLAGGRGVGIRLAISGRKADDYRDGDGHRINNSQFENRNLDLKTHYQLNQQHRLGAEIRINYIDDMGVPQKNQKAPWSHFDRFDSRSYKLNYRGEQLGVIESLQVRAFGVDQDRIYKGNYPGETNYNLKNNRIETTAMGTSIQTRLEPVGNHQTTLGVEFVREGTDSWEVQSIQRNSDDSLARRLIFQPVPDAERDHLGIFVQDEVLIGSRLTLIAGGRYDHFTARTKSIDFTDQRFDATGTMTSSTTERNDFADADDSAATFSLGLLYALTDQHHLTANLGRGFRAPDIFELYSTRGGGSQILLGNPDLKPEYAYNLDLGIKTRYERFQWNTSVFYNRVDDYIDTVRLPEAFISNIPTYQYVNVRNAELYGFDGDAEIQLSQQLSLFAQLAYVVGRDRDSHDRLNSIPPLNGTLGVRWQDDWGKGRLYWLELEGNFHHRRTRPAPGEEENPGYGIANLRGGISLPALGQLREISLTVNIENLFDRYYLAHQRAENRDFIPEPGVNLITALQFSF